jgi:hypothetical protein
MIKNEALAFFQNMRLGFKYYSETLASFCVIVNIKGKGEKQPNNHDAMPRCHLIHPTVAECRTPM